MTSTKCHSHPFRQPLLMTTLLSVASAMAACGGGPDPLLDDESFATESSALTKTQGGTNGASNFCADPANPCNAGEGDCDADSECAAGLVCGTDNGRDYGFSRAVDVCVSAQCLDGIRNGDEEGVDCGGVDCPVCDCSGLPAQDLAGHCTPECPCPSGEGDCNVDEDCDTGLVCVENNGVQFGITNGADICVPASCDNGIQDPAEVSIDCGGACGTVCPNACTSVPPNGNINRCSIGCPCAVQEGDCDSDSECDGTNICVDNVGDSFGFGSSIDMCLASSCTNGIQDGDEDGIDCGPSCVPCASSAEFIDSLGTANRERASDTAVDGSGNVYIIGQYRTSTNLGGGVLNAAVGSSATADEIFLAKYDADGVHQWSRTFGGTASDGDRGLGIGVSSAGTVAITGSFRRTIDFGGGALSSASGADAFVAVFDTDGTFQWADAFGELSQEDSGQDIAIDRGGNIVVTGFFSSTIDFGGGVLTSAGGRDIFVARFDPNGVHQNSASFGGTGNDVGRAIDTDDRRNIYVAGGIANTVTLGSNIFTSLGSEDVFVMRLGRSSFSVNWSVQYGGSNNDFARGIAADRNSRVTVAGAFSDSVAFGTTTATASGTRDAFLLDLASGSGSQNWVRTYGSAGDDQFQSVALDTSSGVVAAAGYFAADLMVGSTTLTNAGGTDAFLLRVNAAGSVIEAFGDGGSADDSAYGVGFGQGILAYYGDFDGTFDLLGDSLTASGSRDLFLALLRR